MSDDERHNCLGGYGFLLLGVGALMFVPAIVLIIVFGDESESDMKAISITLFCTSVGMVGLGITLAFVWCRYTGYSTQKNEDSEDAEDPKPTSNGHTTNASPDAARKDQDAGETSEGQKKKKEKKEKEKNKRESAYTNAAGPNPEEDEASGKHAQSKV